MKKALLLCPMLALVALAGMPGTVSADSFPIANDWVVTSNGTEPTNVYKTENGYMIDHVNTYLETGYFDKHILLDGLSFDIRAENIHNADTFGFYLSKAKATGNIVWTTPTITIWKGLYGSQTRFSISNSHDYNGASSKAHVDKSLESSKDIGAGGQADEGVFNNNSDMTSAGFHIAFAKCDEEWYSINVRSLDSQESWGNNANYNASDKSFTAYIPVSYMSADGIDAEGRTYLHYTGFRSSANNATTDQTIYFENLTYHQIPEDSKQEAIDKIEIVVLDDYDEADRAAIEEAKATALQEIEAAENAEAIQAAVDKFQQVVSSYIKASQKYIDAIYQNAPETLGTMDKTANFKDYYEKGYSSVRLNNEGGFIARVLLGYGQRGVIENKYDPRNIEMNLNFAKVPLNTTSVLTISNDEGGYINDPNAVIYGMDIVKLEEERFFLTLTNSGSHNLSMEGFNSETWHGDYTGRYVNAPRGDIHIKVTTVGDITTFTVNNVSVELDFAVLFKNFVGVDSWLSLGVMSSSAENLLVAVTKIVDATEEEYLTTGTFAQITSKLDEVETAAKDGLTNEIYEEYFDTVDGDFDSKVAHIEALFDSLHGYDKEYLRNRVESIVKVGDTFKPSYESYKRVQKVIADINAIGEVTLDSQDTVEAIEVAYDQLTDEEKAQVSNYNTLVEAKTALEALLASKAKVDAVIEAINAIGTVSKDSETAISNAENLYNALSEKEKAQVSNYSTLVEAKAALEAILESEEKVNNVIEAINAIGTVSKDSGTAISNAENLYNALSEEEKALVTNHDVLVEARETFLELTKPSTGTSASTGTETSTGETKPEKKGCRGSLLSTSILVSAFAIGGVILSLKKKKEEQ